MATNSSDDGHVMPTAESDHEKVAPSPIVQQVDAASSTASDIDADDLPKGYFTRPAFIGTMVAAGLALAGVSISLPSRHLLHTTMLTWFRVVAHSLLLPLFSASLTTILVPTLIISGLHLFIPSRSQLDKFSLAASLICSDADGSLSWGLLLLSSALSLVQPRPQCPFLLVDLFSLGLLQPLNYRTHL